MESVLIEEQSLTCPKCGKDHYDIDEWAVRPHKTHLCLHCGELNEPPTLADCVRWIARLGGFLGRKNDGEPGVKTLWLGLQRVHDMASIWQLLAPNDK